MATFSFRRCLGPATLGLALTLAAGCGSEVPVGGLTNPNPGSMADQDKPATRTDMNVTDQNAGNKEPIAESASSSPSATGTTAGTGGPGGGQPGKDAGVRQASPEAATPAATPNAKENAGAASGATKPAGSIEVGTPRSPQ